MFDWLMTLLFPAHCRGCKTSGVALCSTCIGTIPLAKDLPGHTYAVFDYGNRLVSASIRDLKYHHRSESMRILAEHAVPYISEYLSNIFQSTKHTRIVLVPIPEHIRKLRAKGFNHSALLTTWWKNAIPNSVVQTLLRKSIFTLPQARLNRSNRLKNVTHTMVVNEKLDATLTYIIVDDVTTTGATFDEACRALRASGATKVITLALAHGYAHK